MITASEVSKKPGAVQIVAPRRSAVDVGANIGIYTFMLSRIARRVFAYEPNPEVFPFLRAAARSNVSVFNAGLSSQCGSAVLSVPVVGGAPRDTRGVVTPAHAGTPDGTSIDLRRLDDQGHEDVGFIKIDVEGHELAVIEGARRLLERDRPTLLVEIEERHAGTDALESCDAILSLGYAGFFIDRTRLSPLAEFRHEIHQRLDARGEPTSAYVNNFLFFPNAAPT